MIKWDLGYMVQQSNDAKAHALLTGEPVILTHQLSGSVRCHCGRFKSRMGPCSMEIYSAFTRRWEHH